MNKFEQLLYDRISEISFDDDNQSFTFVNRLARENGWTEEFANRVVVEYKRFVFLAVVANHPVTPSDQVDQVWHLHLTHTKLYWDELCGQVLGAPLHHNPTRGGSEEASKFNRWYQNTLESYTRFFGCEPPSDIWPDASIRFGRDTQYQRINTKQNWVIPKPRFKRIPGRVVVGVLLLCLFIPFAISILAPTGVAQPFEANDNEQAKALEVPWIFIVIISVVIIVSILNLVFKRWCSKCKKQFALEKTGAVQEESEREEWRCKYCDFRVWKKKPPRGNGDSSGCGGCGGCSGCGGCGD